MAFNHTHLFGLEPFSADDIRFVLETAKSFKEISSRPVKKVPTLRGKTIVMGFFEPSTRTRVSFEMAAKRLSADTYNIGSTGTSVVKGETLIDTVRNLEAMKIDLIVMRHKSPGAPQLLARHTDVPILNAGDGPHEHPTQGLLDIMTMTEAKGDLAGKEIAIVGDIAHSRVARSNIYGLSKLGANVRLCGPYTMIPRYVEKLGNVKVFGNIEEALNGADVVMMLRIQKERMPKHLFPSNREYAMRFGLNRRNVQLAKKDAIIMHPGPINRGVEITPDVADGERSVILDQVHNGVAIRMALIYLFTGGKA